MSDAETAPAAAPLLPQSEARERALKLQAEAKLVTDATAKTKPPKKAAKAAGESSEENERQRQQVSNVCQVMTSVARVNSHLRVSLETEDSRKLSDLRKYIRKLQQAIKGDFNAKEKAAGREALTDEEKAKAEEKIAAMRAQCETLAKGQIRLSGDASPAIAAACDWIMTHIFDSVSNNTLCSQHRMISWEFLLDAEKRPKVDIGAQRPVDSPAWTFIGSLPVIVGYNQADEDAAKAARAEENKQKRNEAEERRKTREAAKLAGEEPPETERKKKGKKAVAEGEDTTVTTNFGTYGDKICKAGAGLHPDYEGLRLTQRFREIFAEIMLELVHRMGATARSFVPVTRTCTLTSEIVIKMLEVQQLMNGRSDAEIESLRSHVEQKVALYHQHEAKEKDRRKENEESKKAAMSEQDRAALKAKQAEEQRKKLEATLASQTARARRAAADAKEAKASLEALKKLDTEDPVLSGL